MPNTLDFHAVPSTEFEATFFVSLSDFLIGVINCHMADPVFLDGPTVFVSITGLNSAFAFCLRWTEAAGANSPNLSFFILFGFPLANNLKFWYERIVRGRSVICDVVELGEVD